MKVKFINPISATCTDIKTFQLNKLRDLPAIPQGHKANSIDIHLEIKTQTDIDIIIEFLNNAKPCLPTGKGIVKMF